MKRLIALLLCALLLTPTALADGDYWIELFHGMATDAGLDPIEQSDVPWEYRAYCECQYAERLLVIRGLADGTAEMYAYRYRTKYIILARDEDGRLISLCDQIRFSYPQELICSDRILLSAEQTQAWLALVEEQAFWDVSEKRASPMGFDGYTFRLEGWQNGQTHVINWWGSLRGKDPTQQLSNHMAMLAGMDDMFDAQWDGWIMPSGMQAMIDKCIAAYGQALWRLQYRPAWDDWIQPMLLERAVDLTAEEPQ